uniref:Uncharacterized protein n=1 Tax=Arundo donax TaxID=35708 RepID=A0A0A9BYX5_ARUDO
MCEYFQNRPKL